jgi:hypothetical protein
MDLEHEILREHSKRQALKIARWVGNDKERFKQLMELFLNGDYRITQRSAWILSTCADRYPNLVSPWLKPMIKRMLDPDVHEAVKRNVLHILKYIDIPRSIQGTVATLCFDYLSSLDAPVAVKAFSLTILGRIAEKEPDLRRELGIVIRQMLPYGGPAIRSSAKNVLKRLKLETKISTEKVSYGNETEQPY